MRLSGGDYLGEGVKAFMMMRETSPGRCAAAFCRRHFRFRDDARQARLLLMLAHLKRRCSCKRGIMLGGEEEMLEAIGRAPMSDTPVEDDDELSPAFRADYHSSKFLRHLTSRT